MLALRVPNPDQETPETDDVVQGAMAMLKHNMEVEARDVTRRKRRKKAFPVFICPFPGCDAKFTRSFDLKGAIFGITGTKDCLNALGLVAKRYSIADMTSSGMNLFTPPHTLPVEVVEECLLNCSKEAVLWEQLSHPNLLPIYGLYRLHDQLCLVSPWMEHGNVTQYLQMNQHADRVLLISDISHGLQYLHEHAIIHGDLKGVLTTTFFRSQRPALSSYTSYLQANILVDGCGRACIADFGISSVSDANILAWTSHTSGASKGGSLRWQAPELFDLENDENVPNTAASDIYAWSCVCYEVFTGNIPFVHIARDASVMLQVTKGARPIRKIGEGSENGLTDDIWSLMQDCWATEPVDRPTIEMVINRLAYRTYIDTRPNEETVITPARFRADMRDNVDLTELFISLEDLL
ncbi:hypothetical protein H0H87_002913 [Tephrocybe sp. NHM501043]|nr:hypothetical protein H0H87_002913 [Tephrocybe sp. NHM501043]